MPNRTLIVSMLMPAYLLLVLHSVIPHHHHTPEQYGPVQYQHGSHIHHTYDDHDLPDDPCDHHDHGPVSHFVHAPDFGNGMLRSDADLVIDSPAPCLRMMTLSDLMLTQTYDPPLPSCHVFLWRTTGSKGHDHIERGPPSA